MDNLNLIRFLKRFDEARKQIEEQCKKMNETSKQIIETNQAIRRNFPKAPTASKPKLFIVK